MEKKVLLIGGAGYVGTALTNYLLKKNFQVCCVDNFLYSHFFSIDKLIKNKNYEFHKLDFSQTNKILKIIDKYKNIVFLASLVGDPITKKYPKLTKIINETSTINLIDLCIKKNIEKFIFISTCSNYGIIPETISADENYFLDPISLYAKSKVKVEKYILSKKNYSQFTPVILRFATAFGLSPRMRFDLTISEFVKTLYDKKRLLIYDENTWRPYCHLMDFSELIYKVLNSDNDVVKYQIFNAGSDENNYTKKMIAEKILKYIPNGKVEYSNNGSDPRNYKVNFDKIKTILKFKAKFNLDYGIKELLNYLEKNNKEINKYNLSRYGNYNINYKYD